VIPGQQHDIPVRSRGGLPERVPLALHHQGVHAGLEELVTAQKAELPAGQPP